MGEISARLSDKTIITSDNPRTESPSGIIQEIEAGILTLQSGPPGDYEIIPDRKEAIARSIGLAKPGDVVVIAGKGHEDYQIIGQQRLSFDDREVARDLLAKRIRG
jgi:UDP-N-acetylmuramoyl-L-alanyl-D-glutamate--2,6-diaminopimelate ligase